MKQRKSLLNCCLAALFALFLCGTGNAQTYLLDRTYVNVPTFRSENHAFSTRFSDGSTFVGQRAATYADTRIISESYCGTLTYPDGTKVISVKNVGSFDQRFAANGQFAIEQNGHITFAEFKNGHIQRTFNSERKYQIVNHCIEFFQTPSTGVVINNTPYYGGSGSSSYDSGSSSSGSGYVSKRATCAGCSGTGKCSLCNGRGYNDRGYQCSRCHGTGTCQTCQGVGKLTVY